MDSVYRCANMGIVSEIVGSYLCEARNNSEIIKFFLPAQSTSSCMCRNKAVEGLEAFFEGGASFDQVHDKATK